ncbi:MAG: transcriptional regulator GlxA family with amidase domain [Cocleimonas sp.]|jgi:transcriptional regulator GlxA family with amidase domain
MKNTHSSAAPLRRHFVFLVMPNFSLIAFASAIDFLRLANHINANKIYSWDTITPTDDVVKASNGLEFKPNKTLKEINAYETLFVCGGNNIRDYWTKSIGQWLRQQDTKEVKLGSLCTGAYILARAGLLNNYRCTMHWDHISSTREEFPHLQLSTNIYEIDRNRYTCTGGTASIDLMHHLVSLHHGHILASAVSERLMVDHIRGTGDPQRIPLRLQIGTGQPRLTEAVQLMESNLEECLLPKELADFVGLSVRQLERLFRVHLECTPMQYYIRLRLRNARRLLLQSELSIYDVAISSGFKSAPHFSKSYKDMFDITPSKERKMFLKNVVKKAK